MTILKNGGKNLSKTKPEEDIEEVDFNIINEDWSRYTLEDGTTLRLRITILKIFRSSKLTDLGYPSFGMSSRNLISCLVPSHLKDKFPKGRYRPSKDLDKELKFTRDKEETQIYETFDGWRIVVQPKLAKVFRFKRSNDFGEPIYSINLQQFVNVEKIAKKKR